MKKPQEEGHTEPTDNSSWSSRKITRRQFTTLVSGLAAAAAVARKAPAQVKGTTLNVLYGTWFVPAAETIFKKQLEDWGKQAGVTVNYESIQWPQIQAKVTAAIAANAGPDIIQFWGFWPHLYKENLVDVSDVVADLVKDQGKLYDNADRVCKVGGTYLAVPQTSAFPGLPNYRMSWVKEAGFDPDPDKLPNTWEKLEPLGKALKKAGHPMGQALGHSTSDPYAIYKVMWDYGIYETDESGKKVVFDAKAMTEVMTWFVNFWKEAFTPTGLSWDDTGNNRAFLAGQVGWTINGSSVYYAAKNDAPEVFKDMNHQPMFGGPKAKTSFSTMVEHAIPKYSKNQKAAKELIGYLIKKDNYAKWFDVQISYLNGPTDFWGPDYAGWKTADPRLRPFADFAKYVRLPGYAGPPDAKAAEAMSKFIIVDMFARAVSGKDEPKAAVQWAVEQLKAIYEKS